MQSGERLPGLHPGYWIVGRILDWPYRTTDVDGSKIVLDDRESRVQTPAPMYTAHALPLSLLSLPLTGREARV